MGPGAWERTEYKFDVPVLVWAIWAVADRFVVVAERDTPEAAWLFLSSETGRDWELAMAPPEVERIYHETGVVVDSRLWFIARVRGESGLPAHLVSTTTGADWDLLPAARNLGARDGAYFLANAGGRWFAGPHRDTPGEPFATIEQDVRVSDDGVRWSIVDTPRGGVRTLYSDAEVLLDKIVIKGRRDEDDGQDITQQEFFMSSRDGGAWDATDFRPARNTQAHGYACGLATCVLVGDLTDDDGNFEHPFAWTSTDGLHWVPSERPIEFPADRSSIGMFDVTWTGSEFLALGGGPDGGAWLSEDGTVWRYVEIIDPHLGEGAGRFAALGDRVVSVTDPGDGSGRVTIWIGSLQAMRR